jgi:transposase
MTPQVGLVTQPYQMSSYDVLVYKVSTSTDPLRLRSGTGTSYKILAKYKKGTEVIVLNKTTSSWYEVTCPDGRHGYMASEYLTYVRTETQSVRENVGFRNQVVEARQLRDQPFRIYRVVPDLTKITVYARHVFYDLMDNMIKSYKPSSSTVGASVVQNISSGCLSPHDFTFYSDLYYYQNNQSTKEERSGTIGKGVVKVPKTYTINAEQVKEIRERRKKVKDKQTDKRLHAVQMRGEGKKNSEIATILEMSSDVVSRWVAAYAKGGIEALAPKPRTGRRLMMSFEAEERLLETFAAKAEAGEIVEVSDIKKLYQDKVGHKIASGQIYYMLARHNWRKVKPRSRHPKKASEEVIAASKKLTIG